MIPWVKGAWEKIPGLVDAGAGKDALLGLTASAKLGEDGITVTMRPRALDGRAEIPEGLGVFAVLYRKSAVTKIDAGENDGKTLTEYLVALEMTQPAPLAGAMEKAVTVKLKSPEGVEASDLGVAVLVENAETLRTLDCWTVPVYP